MVDNQHISHFPKNALCLVASYNVCSFWHLRTRSNRPKNSVPGKRYSMIAQCHSAIMKRNKWCKWINVNSNILCCTCAYKVEPTSRSPLASPFWMNCWPGNTSVYKIWRIIHCIISIESPCVCPKQIQQYQDDWAILASSAWHNKRKGNSERWANPIWNKQGERERTETQNESYNNFVVWG